MNYNIIYQLLFNLASDNTNKNSNKTNGKYLKNSDCINKKKPIRFRQNLSTSRLYSNLKERSRQQIPT